MRCPLIQLGVTVEEIRNRLNNATDEGVTIVTMMPSDNIQGHHGTFVGVIAPLLVMENWTLSITARPNQMVTLVYLSNTW
jgi:hypothetical protein